MSARPDRAGPSRPRLAELRAAGLIRSASEPVDTVSTLLPVGGPLRHLLPSGGLRRGATIALPPPAAHLPPGTAQPGATSLLIALIAAASAAGSWCAVVNLAQLGLVAAAEAGVAVERFALVPCPGPEWPSVVAALCDGFDIVIVATSEIVSADVASRLSARARQRGTVLISIGRWPGAELTLATITATWHGLGQGRGRLRSQEIEVVASGRGAAARTRRLRLLLPAQVPGEAEPVTVAAFRGVA